ncbi:unnamed protein product, partial [Ectocarpus fasciculatus]
RSVNTHLARRRLCYTNSLAPSPKARVKSAATWICFYQVTRRPRQHELHMSTRRSNRDKNTHQKNESQQAKCQRTRVAKAKKSVANATEALKPEGLDALHVEDVTVLQGCPAGHRDLSPSPD